MTDAPPESIAHAFAAAWNAGDAAALAALFDADAEFVNVVGLWWHSRDEIERAHAYGLARLFPGSTLRVAATRTKTLAEGVAVVHARMRLTGQAPIAGVDAPRVRTTVFSFVVHRTSDGWRCASAHNTDVVAGMETHVRDEAGVLRPADGRATNAPKTGDAAGTATGDGNLRPEAP